MIIKRVYAFILALFIILSPLSFGLQINSNASLVEQIVSYIPELNIGDVVSAVDGWYTLPITDFLSHVLMDGLSDEQIKNLGYVWNRVVDSGYCPGNLNTHRHNFIYGLTSTRLTVDFTKPQNGYYCYCEYCGQMAGDLIETYIRESDIQPDGRIKIYCFSDAYVNYQNGNFFNLYINNFENNPEIILDVNSVIGVSWRENVCRVDFLKMNGTGVSGGMVLNVENLIGNINNIHMYSNDLNRQSFDKNGNRVSNDSFDIPREILNAPHLYIDNKYYVSLFGSGIFTSSSSIGYNVGVFDENIDRTEYVFALAELNEEELNNNFNYDNINAPIVYNDNGNYRYYGESSEIVDSNNNTYYNPRTNKTYDYSSAEYDYSTNTYSLVIPDYDKDGIEDNTTVTVEYNNDYLRILEPLGTYIFKYLTNTQTPVFDPEVPGQSSVNLSGTINLDVNQRPSNTDAYITTPEDIPNGIVNLREKLATMFTALPNMFGEFAVFMTAGFSYIPEEIRTLLLFGVTTSVFVGLFKMFWR